MRSIVRVTRTKGDKLAPLAAQLKQKNASGAYEAVDLTQYTIKFRMCDEDGAVVIAETEDDVMTVDAEEGKVYYDFQESYDVGTYYCWFLVYSGNECDTFPVDGNTFELRIVDKTE